MEKKYTRIRHNVSETSRQLAEEYIKTLSKQKVPFPLGGFCEGTQRSRRIDGTSLELVWHRQTESNTHKVREL